MDNRLSVAGPIKAQLLNDLDAVMWRIVKEAKRLGYRAKARASNVSYSRYVLVCRNCAENNCSQLEFGGCPQHAQKIRISDHRLPMTYDQPTFDVMSRYKVRGTAHGTWVDCIEWLAEQVGKPHPRICKIARTRSRGQPK